MMPYSFRDTNSAAANYRLPAEALKINGEYIEELFANDLTLGATYETANVSGRELMAQEATDIEVGTRHGSFLKSRRFKPREIVVTYKLQASSNEHFRAAYNKLCSILDVEDAELIFADEPDKFFTGTVTEVGEVEPGRNAVFGEFTITCFDPFKYSVELYDVEATDGDFLIDYRGTQKAHPMLCVDFYKSSTSDNRDGECGYVAFFNDRGKLLQFGNPEETDLVNEKIEKITSQTTVTTTTITKANQLITEEFNSQGSWGINDGFMSNDLNAQVGTASFSLFPSGVNKVFMPSSYVESGKTDADYPSWHGPSVSKVIPNTTGDARSADFTFSFIARFCCASNENTGKKQAGILQSFITDSSGAWICGFHVWKNAGTTKGTIRVFVKGHSYVKEWKDIDLSWHNKYFGYQKGNGAAPNLNVSIKKKDSTFTFNIAGLTYSFKADALKNKQAYKVTMYQAKYKDKPAMERTGIYSCKFVDDSMKRTVSTSKTTENIQYLSRIVDVTNTFGTNDRLVVDCNRGEVRMMDVNCDIIGDEAAGGELRPELGALGNQWEDFTLEPGTNQIGFSYSDWVDDEYAPTPKLLYREVFL